MATLGVRWGATPDISGSMQSLGASLAGAVSSNPNSKAARDAAYIESLGHHNQVYDNQAAKIAAETAAKQQELDFANQQQGRAQSAAESAWQAEDARIKPAGVGVLPLGSPAIVQYDTGSKAAHDRMNYIYGNGDGTPEQRAGAANQAAGGLMVQQGSQNDYVRGNSLLGKNIGEKDMLPGAGSAAPVPVETKQTADKAVFNKDKTMQLVPDPKNPGRFTQVPVGGISAGSNNQEAIDAVTRANSAYQRLADSGGVGPWVGGTIGRTIEHFIPGNEHAKMRDEYEAARSKLILMERQRLMRGQGAVSDKDAAQIENMFPRFDSTDPQVGIRTLQEMQKRLSAGQAMLTSGGETQSSEGDIQPGHIEDGHRYVGGDPASPSSWEPL